MNVEVAASWKRTWTHALWIGEQEVARWIVLWLVSAALQWWGGAYHQEFGGHPDEAAHYVTGLMVHDYLKEAFGTHPKRYADTYYEHYPKVALGHYPPVFYLVQSAWTLVFGVSRTSVLLLMSLLSAGCARLIQWVIARTQGVAAGWIAALIWLSLGYVQTYTGMLMADLLVALLMLVAAICWGYYLDSGARWFSIGFGLVASLAILTKGSALLLALVVPLAVFWTGQYQVLRRMTFWLPAVLVAVLSGPWTLYFREVNKEGWADGGGSWQFVRDASALYPKVALQELGWPLCLLGVLGAFAWMRQRMKGQSLDPRSVTVVALLPAVCIFHTMVPVALEQRYLIPAFPAVIVLAVVGFRELHGWLQRVPVGRRLSQPVLASALVVLHGWGTFRVAVEKSAGFEPAAAALLGMPELADTRILVSSDARGEGQFIAAIAAHEKRPGHWVRRASKFLAAATWNGGNYQARIRDPAELTALLNREQIRAVVVDLSVPPERLMPHHRVVQAWWEQRRAASPHLYIGPVTRRDQAVPDAMGVMVRPSGETW